MTTWAPGTPPAAVSDQCPSAATTASHRPPAGPVTSSRTRVPTGRASAPSVCGRARAKVSSTGATTSGVSKPGRPTASRTCCWCTQYSVYSRATSSQRGVGCAPAQGTSTSAGPSRSASAQCASSCSPSRVWRSRSTRGLSCRATRTNSPLARSSRSGSVAPGGSATRWPSRVADSRRAWSWTTWARTSPTVQPGTASRSQSAGSSPPSSSCRAARSRGNSGRTSIAGPSAPTGTTMSPPVRVPLPAQVSRSLSIRRAEPMTPSSPIVAR